jgi:ribosomal protein L28
MSTKCALCGRGPTRDASRSHSNIQTIKRQRLNLQTRKINGRRQAVCARCLKTLAKNK